MNMDDSIQKSVSGVSDKSEYITMDEYNKIETGMSYDEVSKIIGSKGELSTQSEANGYTIEIYTWYGNGTAGSNANVTFENGKATLYARGDAGLIAKTTSGLTLDNGKTYDI